MPNKPVNDAANSELQVRLERVLSHFDILKSVAEYLNDRTLQRKIKEARFGIFHIINEVRRKYGVKVKRNTPPEDL